MPELSGFPSAELQFDRNGNVVGDTDAVLALANGPSTDLLVMSHGWNNEPREARDLYRQFAAALRTGLERVPAASGRRIALVGVIWPSMKFANEDGSFGGGAAAGADSPLAAAEVANQVEALRVLFPDAEEQQTLDAVTALLPDLEDSADARRQFAELVLSLLDRDAVDDEDASAEMVAMDGGEVMDRLAAPLPLPPPGPGDDAVGGAAGFGDFLTGALSAAKKLMNFTSYFEMKARSGTVGANGVAPVIARIKQARPDLKVHLLGHSFGARLVAATANALPADSVASMSLLQGAFSHHGFAHDFEPGRDGAFRRVVDHKTVRGPVLITNTANDRAVGLAYAIASRVSNDPAAGLGDAGDRFGGIGRNGAVRTAEAVTGRLLPVGGSYAFRPGALHNLLADEFVANHSDIKGPQVAYAVLSALATT